MCETTVRAKKFSKGSGQQKKICIYIYIRSKHLESEIKQVASFTIASNLWNR